MAKLLAQNTLYIINDYNFHTYSYLISIYNLKQHICDIRHFLFIISASPNKAREANIKSKSATIIPSVLLNKLKVVTV